MPKKDKLKNVKKILARVVKTGSVSKVAKEERVHPTALRYHLRRNKKQLAAYNKVVREQEKARKAKKKAA